MKNCKCNEVIGGPSTSKITCKSCKKEWIRYKGGSWDWQYKDCPSCETKRVLDSIDVNKIKGKWGQS